MDNSIKKCLQKVIAETALKSNIDESKKDGLVEFINSCDEYTLMGIILNEDTSNLDDPGKEKLEERFNSSTVGIVLYDHFKHVTEALLSKVLNDNLKSFVSREKAKCNTYKGSKKSLCLANLKVKELDQKMKVYKMAMMEARKKGIKKTIDRIKKESIPKLKEKIKIAKNKLKALKLMK
jgi:hypothetical protein